MGDVHTGQRTADEQEEQNKMNRRTARNRKIRKRMHALQYPAAMLLTCRARQRRRPWLRPWLASREMSREERKMKLPDLNNIRKTTDTNIFMHYAGIAERALRPFFVIFISEIAFKTGSKKEHSYCILPRITRRITNVIGT